MNMIIDGKLIAQELKDEVKAKLAKLDTKLTLLVIMVGDNPASKVYVESKEKNCKKVGMLTKTLLFDANVPQKKIIDAIKQANEDPEINGILVQLPLPAHLDEVKIIDAIDPKKDVDGLTTINQGKLFSGVNDGIIPATPKGIMHILKKLFINIEGKKAVVIGRSKLVGKPIAQLLLAKNATVTMCHSKTENLKDICLGADILVVAIGKAKFITADMIKQDAIVIDVGINRNFGRIDGDVDFENAVSVAGYITPVPGGVGQLTIACLLENVIECYKLQTRE
ncbi:MAG: bifunctional 5,10-methylenetetrahydrofolate dehydrogenase/5,10-methenyltetrahydrofolate cyclohydrolase [Bacilli bacterium]|nr:bifunctional 5,10-methylenetetrahydrofolate dehydrogenase/5,10-methenyltetrahydrofolate cyclohydrolase [Bacilli bacterium]